MSEQIGCPSNVRRVMFREERGSSISELMQMHSEAEGFSSAPSNRQVQGISVRPALYRGPQGLM
jgi:hypothetical protein